MSDIQPPLDQAVFKRRLHEALVDLYDPTVLTASPLIEWMELEGEANKAQALRSALAEAIETLKPSDDNPKVAKSWRVYQILSLRFTGQWTQRRVADNIGLSERQLQRDEKEAFNMLANWLWSQTMAKKLNHLPENKKDKPNVSDASGDEKLLSLDTEIPAQRVELRQSTATEFFSDR